MQPLIDKLASITGNNIGLTIGWVLVGALLAHTALVLYSSVRRIFFERQQRRASRERLQLLVKAAATQWREAEQAKLLWNGYRKFRVARKVSECEDIYSFYLSPHDGKSLPPFKPGQYLTFQLDIPGRDKPVIRCYSISDSPNHPDYYRVTIKKALPPPDPPGAQPGVASCFFCDQVNEGDILNVKAPAGNFHLDMTKPTPVVLISGGVGITPMLSMANAIAEAAAKREVWFFFGARNRGEHIQKEHLERLAREHPNIHMNVCYSRPSANDKQGHDYLHSERVSVDLFKRVLPSNNFDFFICGPPGMMKSVTDDLKAWGVPDHHVFFEAFGPATVKKAAPKPAIPAGTAPTLEVTFSRSGRSCIWNPNLNSLLDFADEQGIKIDAGCRAGNCGTCLVAIKSGSIEYVTEHGAVPEDGSCLTCICKPKTSLVLDA
jgi:ferredoxin-NADP reductase